MEVLPEVSFLFGTVWVLSFFTLTSVCGWVIFVTCFREPTNLKPPSELRRQSIRSEPSPASSRPKKSKRTPRSAATAEAPSATEPLLQDELRSDSSVVSADTEPGVGQQPKGVRQEATLSRTPAERPEPAEQQGSAEQQGLAEQLNAGAGKPLPGSVPPKSVPSKKSAQGPGKPVANPTAVSRKKAQGKAGAGKPSSRHGSPPSASTPPSASSDATAEPPARHGSPPSEGDSPFHASPSKSAAAAAVGAGADGVRSPLPLPERETRPPDDDSLGRRISRRRLDTASARARRQPGTIYVGDLSCEGHGPDSAATAEFIYQRVQRATPPEVESVICKR